MNVFIWEMKANRKSLIIWSMIMILLIAGSMGKYSSLSVSGQSINDFFQKMPSTLKAIMGMGTFDLTKAIDYYGVLFIYIAIMSTIHATMLGVNIMSKEEREKTAEFLFIKPISRKKIITAKLLSAFVNILILNIVTFLSSVLMVQKYSEEVVTYDITLLMVGMFILQVLFLLIGTAVAAASYSPKTAPSFAIGILLSTFMLSIAIDIDKRIQILKYLTPFKYFDSKSIIKGTGFEITYIILSVFIIGALFLVTYAFYVSKDLT